MKKWEIRSPIDSSFSNKFPEIDPVILQLLFNRGLDNQELIDEFLYPDYNKDIHDPYLFRDMDKAVDRVINAIRKKEKIIVYGDYDADGVTSSVVVVSTLRLLGLNPEIYIPHRETEGYGMNEDSVKEIISKKYDLVITVDCGISNKQYVRLLKDNNVDVIITDHHHEPLQLPDAFAIINPKIEADTYPYKTLAGVGVAFKFMQGILKKLQKKNVIEKEIFDPYGGYAGFEKWLLDLVAIGTITDCMPLIGENRTLVKYGLIVLRKTKRLGIRELIAHADINIDKLETYQVAFQIGPRINAAGRMDHANIAYELLLTDKQDEACELSNRLNDTNIARQKITESIVNSVKSQLHDIEKQKILFAKGEDWMVGVIGLVAGKITDEYQKPTIVMSQNREEIIGSGRSIPEFNIIEALEELNQYFSQYGGHSQACGFTLKDNDQLEAFMSDMRKIAKRQLSKVDLTPILEIDTEITLDQIQWDLLQMLENFMPFGEGNYDPKFCIKNLEIVDMQLVGQRRDHLRCILRENGKTVRKAIGFGLGNTWGTHLKIGDYIDVVANISVNEWNGNREIQLKLIDLRFAK